VAVPRSSAAPSSASPSPATAGGAGNNPKLGKLCPGTFTVNTSTSVGALFFRKGAYLI
jgi:hypothetical protein